MFFRLITKCVAVMILCIVAFSCSKKSPTKSIDTRTGSLLLSRLNVSVVPGGSELIMVTAKNKDGLKESFITVCDSPGVATLTSVNDSVFRVTGVNYGKANVTVTSLSGISKTVPVWVYNHKVLDVGELLITFCDAFTYRWNDLGSGGTYDGSYWHPAATDGFKPLGSLGFRGYYNPNGIHAVMVVKAKEGSNALAAPVDYAWVYHDVGSGAYDDVSFWTPIPPAGYKAMGTVAQAGWGKPSLNDVVCVREGLTITGESGDFIWIDQGTGATYYFGSWKIDPPDAGPHDDAYLATGTFVGWNQWSPPLVHTVMNVLNVPLPMLAEAPYQTYVPKLTGYDTPPGETVPLMAKAMLVPCTIVKDGLYDGEQSPLENHQFTFLSFGENGLLQTFVS